MNRILIALAAAGLLTVPAFAATSNVDVYGTLNITIQDTDVAGTDLSVIDNTSKIGFKGSEDLGGGLKAIWQIESGLASGGVASANVVGNAATLATRNTFVGLAGGFGTVLMGRHDTPYKLGTGSLDIFADSIGDYNQGRLDGVSLINNAHDHRNGQALAYISPTLSGFHAAAAVVLNNGEAGSALSNGTTIDATSLTGVYSNGPWFGSLSLQNAKSLNNKGTKLGLGYTMGTGKVGFVWERTDSNVAGADTRAWLLNGVYTRGPIAMKVQYGKNDAGAAANQDAWMLGADYNLSKRTTAYVVYGIGDNGVGSDVSGWNLGMKHNF
ncbi:MAG: porin [Pseudomonadota bacterium]